MSGILSWITYLCAMIAARLISWWERKPYEWGEDLVTKTLITLSKAEWERSIREWD